MAAKKNIKMRRISVALCNSSCTGVHPLYFLSRLHPDDLVRIQYIILIFRWIICILALYDGFLSDVWRFVAIAQCNALFLYLIRSIFVVKRLTYWYQNVYFIVFRYSYHFIRSYSEWGLVSFRLFSLDFFSKKVEIWWIETMQ